MNMNEWISILLGQTSTIATLLSGWIAYNVYKHSKEDEVDTAARILFLEVKESEKELKKLIEYKINTGGDNYPHTDIIKLIQNKAWSKYSHLFIDKLTTDEYEQLNAYFKKCEIIEKYFEKQHNFFWVTTEERARMHEQLGSKLAYENQTLDDKTLNAIFEKTSALYRRNTTLYSPQGITSEINKQLESITLPSVTPLWNKLKELAKYSR